MFFFFFFFTTENPLKVTNKDRHSQVWFTILIFIIISFSLKIEAVHPV